MNGQFTLFLFSISLLGYYGESYKLGRFETSSESEMPSLKRRIRISETFPPRPRSHAKFIRVLRKRQSDNPLVQVEPSEDIRINNFWRNFANIVASDAVDLEKVEVTIADEKGKENANENLEVVLVNENESDALAKTVNESDLPSTNEKRSEIVVMEEMKEDQSESKVDETISPSPGLSSRSESRIPSLRYYQKVARDQQRKINRYPLPLSYEMGYPDQVSPNSPLTYYSPPPQSQSALSAPMIIPGSVPTYVGIGYYTSTNPIYQNSQMSGYPAYMTPSQTNEMPVHAHGFQDQNYPPLTPSQDGGNYLSPVPRNERSVRYVSSTFHPQQSYFSSIATQPIMYQGRGGFHT